MKAMLRICTSIGLLAAVLLAAGCATTGGEAPVYEQSAAAPAGSAAATGEAPGSEPAPPSSTPAVVALLQSSRQQARAGQPARAAALLERALRIEPRNAALWHNLAAVRLSQQRYSQAESLALRSNSLAGADRKLQADNWRVIAAARGGRGDQAGARRAEDRAARLAPGGS
jgi:tetratricopeptide (TPR) repeat protein